MPLSPSPSVPRLRAIIAACVMSLAIGASASHAALYGFNLTSPSGVTLSALNVKAPTTGTLIGNYDAAANPTGTRTKPGISGSFGATENVACPISLALETSGKTSLTTGGTFNLAVDLLAGTATLSNYSATRTSGGTGPTTSGTLVTDGFRTRTPTSTYFATGSSGITLPLGAADITALTLTQPAASVGTLSPTGANTYHLTIATLLDVTATVQTVGNTFNQTAPATPVLLDGTLTLLAGGGATFSATSDLTSSQTSTTPQIIPQFPYALPTLLPPGSTANVLMDLTLTSLTASLTGTLNTTATGTTIPEPLTALPLAAVAALLPRRRSTK